MILNSACASAVRRAFAVVLTAARAAVTVVPMLSPRTIGTAVQISRSPASASAMVMPIVADELCTRTVQSVPTVTAPRTLQNGRKPAAEGAQLKVRKISMNSGILATILSSLDIVIIP